MKQLTVRFARITLTTALLWLGGREPILAAGSISLEEAALQAASDRYGIPLENLLVAGSTLGEFPLLGIQTSVFTLEDQDKGDVYVVELDEAGQEWDPAVLAELELEEQFRYLDLYGRMDPSLSEYLKKAPPEELIDVVIWLKEPPSPDPDIPEPGSEEKPPEPWEIDQFYSQVDQHRMLEIQKLAGDLDIENMKALVEESGQTELIYEIDELSPILRTSLLPGAIERLARQMDQFAWISRPETAAPTADFSEPGPPIRADVLQNERGLTGSGVKVAQVEVGGWVATNNPRLSDVARDDTSACRAADPHATAVAGIITHFIAPDSTLWSGSSCTGNHGQLERHAKSAANAGARVLNFSFGTFFPERKPQGHDRFFDDLVLRRRRLVVVAAGNEGLGGGEVLSPAMAYNVLSVGNYDDLGTPEWGDDVMSSSSSFLDPRSRKNDRQKPEVAAPGTLLRSTSTTFSSVNGWFTTFLAPNQPITGTSFAAPMVTGGAALLIQRNGVLAFWPEALRSILMATAVHNVDGLDSRLSDQDGAGGIALDLADDVVTRTAGRFGRRRYDCAAPNPLNVTTFWLNADRRTRVAIAWNTDPAFSDTRYKNRPSADLDLQILGPDGRVAARSVSFDNTYEIVELYPAATGQHTLRVRRKDCLASPRRLGWAWYQEN